MQTFLHGITFVGWLKRHWKLSVPSAVLAFCGGVVIPFIKSYSLPASINKPTTDSWLDFWVCLLNILILLAMSAACLHLGGKVRGWLTGDSKRRFTRFWNEWSMFLFMSLVYYLICALFAYPRFPMTETAQGIISNYQAGFVQTRPGEFASKVVENGISLFFDLYLFRAYAVLVSNDPLPNTNAGETPADVEDEIRYRRQTLSIALNIGILCVLIGLVSYGTFAFLELMTAYSATGALGWSMQVASDPNTRSVLEPLDMIGNWSFGLGLAVIAWGLGSRLMGTPKILTILFFCYALLEVLLVATDYLPDRHAIGLTSAAFRGIGALLKLLLLFCVAWLAESGRLSFYLWHYPRQPKPA